jgi:hypothetical protein
MNVVLSTYPIFLRSVVASWIGVAVHCTFEKKKKKKKKKKERKFLFDSFFQLVSFFFALEALSLVCDVRYAAKG